VAVPDAAKLEKNDGKSLFGLKPIEEKKEEEIKQPEKNSAEQNSLASQGKGLFG
jgi:hypothetical protein